MMWARHSRRTDPIPSCSENLNHVVPLGRLGNALIVQRAATVNDNGRVQRRKRIGGMLSY
jgi:hypothetical protein